jgi:hypothetical protein
MPLALIGMWQQVNNLIMKKTAPTLSNGFARDLYIICLAAELQKK